MLGDGVWEGVRLHNGVLFDVEDHFDRMWEVWRLYYRLALPASVTRAEPLRGFDHSLAAKHSRHLIAVTLLPLNRGSQLWILTSGSRLSH